MGCKEICVVFMLSVAVATVQSKDRNQNKYKVVCYLGSWANYRPGDGKFLIEDINPQLCTHLIYGFAKLENNKITTYDAWLDLKDGGGLGAFQRFNGLKNANPNLSTLIAIGGWNEGSAKYSQMAADAGARKTFVRSVIDFCKLYGFDGLDVDWEYPANRGGAPADKQNFVTLLKELKEALEPEGLLLSAAVSAGKSTMDTAYDISQMSKYLDFINVMAYDMHGSWETQVGHNAPLYARPEEPEANKILNVDYAINYWIKNGAPRNKIILGMGLYGRSFTLASPSNTNIDAAATGPGSAGPITKEPGMLGYNEICLSVKNGWTEVFVDKVDAPYAYSGNQWVGYDNKKSIEIKVDYVIKNNLGGGMVWSIETDDFKGKCFGEKYPLLSTIAQNLNGPISKGKPVTLGNIEVTAPPPTSRPTINRPTENRPTENRPTENRPISKPGQSFECTEEGYFRDPSNCEVYYQCVKMGNELMKYANTCSATTAFDEEIKTCNFKDQVKGC